MKKVVVIDDELQLLETLGDFLTLSGFQPTLFSNAQLALEYLETNETDVVVCDYLMPEMNGLGVHNVLHATKKQEQTAFILLTAFSDIYTLLQLENVQPDLVLLKPLSCEVLSDHIKTLTK